MNKAFIIIIEPALFDAQKHAKMLEILKKDDNMVNWWHHITNTYIIITKGNVTAESVQKFIKLHFLTNHFLVLEIPKIKDYNGWLSPQAWTWIETNLK